MLIQVKARLITLLHKLGIDQNGLWLANRYPQYEIGIGSYGHPKILDWGQYTTLKIGKYCSIAPKVTLLLGGEHRTDWVTTYPFNILLNEYRYIKGHPSTKGDIVIGHDVWIGYGATIFSGVTIGNGAIIGGQAVITRNVPAYSIVVGNPQRVIKQRFPKEVAGLVEASAWWDWPQARISEAIPLLLSNDIEAFLKC